MNDGGAQNLRPRFAEIAIYELSRDQVISCSDHRRRLVSISRAKKARVFARDNYRCCYCGYDMTLHFAYPHLNVLTVDHVVPRSQGGKHAYDNLVTCCRWCNKKKRNLALETFAALSASRHAIDRGHKGTGSTETGGTES